MTEAIPPGTRYARLPSPFPFKRGGSLAGAVNEQQFTFRRRRKHVPSVVHEAGVPPKAGLLPFPHLLQFFLRGQDYL